MRMRVLQMLSAIGETLESPFSGSAPRAATEAVTGIIMSARPNFYRIAIWTRTADEEASGDLDARLMDIGRHFKVGILGRQLGEKAHGGLLSEVEFQSHKESEKKKGKKFTV